MVRPQYTPKQRAFIVSEFNRSGSATDTLRSFRRRFPNVRCPSRQAVYNNVRKYKNSGTSENQNKGNSGRRRSSRSPQNIQAVQNLLQQPQQNRPQQISSRRNGLGLTQSTFSRITRLDLRLHPFKMIRHHELFQGDPARRVAFCNWLLARPQRFLDNFGIGDEASFAMNGTVNSQNVREYAPRGQKPLNFDYEKKDSRQNITVWVGLIGNGDIIGPFFFQQNVNGQAYLDMINQQVVPFIDHRLPRFRRQPNGQFRRLWWAQDGAPAHRMRQVTVRLRQLFGNRVVALNHPTEWPPRSPDLTPLDFFLWGYLKNRVYTTPPADLNDLQQRIIQEVNVLKQNRPMVRRAVWAMLHRAQLCIQRNGGHVEA